jgi:hypothetical protein
VDEGADKKPGFVYVALAVTSKALEMSDHI